MEIPNTKSIFHFLERLVNYKKSQIMYLQTKLARNPTTVGTVEYESEPSVNEAHPQGLCVIRTLSFFGNVMSISELILHAGS
jgi:hypothetical protein